MASCGAGDVGIFSVWGDENGHEIVSDASGMGNTFDNRLVHVDVSAKDDDDPIRPSEDRANVPRQRAETPLQLLSRQSDPSLSLRSAAKLARRPYRPRSPNLGRIEDGVVTMVLKCSGFVALAVSGLTFGCGGSFEEKSLSQGEDQAAVPEKFSFQELDGALATASLATFEELAQVPGVSPTVAEKIVTTRRGADGLDETPDDSPFLELSALYSVGLNDEAIAALSAVYKTRAQNAEPIPATAIRTDSPLDCSTLTAKARKFADARGYCGTNSALETNGSMSQRPSALEIGAGPCGTTWIDTDNARGKGRATIKYGFTSSVGAMVRAYPNLYWYNMNTGTTDRYEMTSRRFFSPVWASKKKRVRTGKGEVCSDIGGHVKLFWGLECKLAVDMDCTNIK